MSTALNNTIPGWYIEFQTSLLRQAPRPDEIDQVTAQAWINNQKSLKKNLADSLLPQPGTCLLKRLKLVSGDNKFILDALDGKETLAKAKKTFRAGIDENLKKWGTDKTGIATKEQVVDIYDLFINSTFEQMFNSLGTDLDKLCLTQSQIINFCFKYSDWLGKNGHAVSFLFKVENQFFIAKVKRFTDGLYIRVFRFEDDNTWDAEGVHRVVLPKLSKLL